MGIHLPLGGDLNRAREFVGASDTLLFNSSSPAERLWMLLSEYLFRKTIMRTNHE